MARKLLEEDEEEDEEEEKEIEADDEEGGEKKKNEDEGNSKEIIDNQFSDSNMDNSEKQTSSREDNDSGDTLPAVSTRTC